MTQDKAPAWLKAMKPSPDLATSFVGREGGWEVEARWWWLPGEARAPGPTGPREILIRPTSDLGPDAARRGITTTILRRVEKMIGDFQRSYFGTDERHEGERLWREALSEKASKLPTGPRANPDGYYMGLLDLFEIIEAVSTEPVQVLAEVLGVSPNTVKTRLRAARQRAKG